MTKADAGSRKSLNKSFDKYFDHMLVKCEQNRIGAYGFFDANHGYSILTKHWRHFGNSKNVKSIGQK